MRTNAHELFVLVDFEVRKDACGFFQDSAAPTLRDRNIPTENRAVDMISADAFRRIAVYLSDNGDSLCRRAGTYTQQIVAILARHLPVK